jgi:D-alanine-D-alanine ligase
MGKRKQVGVFFGGRSVEHEISIITALQLISAMDTRFFEPIPVYIDQSGCWYTGAPLLNREFFLSFGQRKNELTEVTIIPKPGVGGLTRVSKDGVIPIDIALLAFHGRYGEDGSFQGLLEMAGIPYTGCGIAGSSIAMDKAHCKAILQSRKIPVLPGCSVTNEMCRTNFQKTLLWTTSRPGLEQFPLFVKPVSLGSSVGISRAQTYEELGSSLAKVFKYDPVALVEPCVENLLEVNISVMGGETPSPSVVEIPVATNGALSYEDKYMRGGKGKNDPAGSAGGMAALSREIDPPGLSKRMKSKITEYALEAFRALDCGGVVRFDFMIDCNDDSIYFNELNPMPGSFAFYLWNETNPPVFYTELITKMILEGEERFLRRSYRTLDFGFKALSRTK